jgi:hypothetical protein
MNLLQATVTVKSKENVFMFENLQSIIRHIVYRNKPMSIIDYIANSKITFPFTSFVMEDGMKAIVTISHVTQDEIDTLKYRLEDYLDVLDIPNVHIPHVKLLKNLFNNRYEFVIVYVTHKDTSNDELLKNLLHIATLDLKAVTEKNNTVTMDGNVINLKIIK